MTRRLIEDYQVGWICALPKELTAARAVLDEEHEDWHERVGQDTNRYVLGRVHEHNVVMACLPAGVYGTNSAATVAINMLRTYTGIRFGLMVGIGGGIPNLDKEWDIRLGDVVVSQPDGTYGGVVQYDLRKNLGEGKYERKGFLQPPPKPLLTVLSYLQSQHELHGHRIPEILLASFQRLPRLAKLGYTCPDIASDVLRCTHTHDHPEAASCPNCQDEIVFRKPRAEMGPEIHYGIIASGNELMKDAIERDRIGRELGAMCFEMEAAGLMNDFPCLVVRGICDYADSAKNDRWQNYAALTAAAFAKELLSVMKPTEVMRVTHAKEAVNKYTKPSPEYNRGLNLFDAPEMDKSLFIGRGTEMQEMDKILLPQTVSTWSNRRVLILGGMGGIGKTQLAVAYAKECKLLYSSIFWIDARSEAATVASFRAVAYRILPEEMVDQLEDDKVRIRVSNWLSELENTRWLLIFDNFDDPDQYDLKTYFPAVAQGSIIVTTRQPGRINGIRLKIGAMKEIEDGLLILATRSERPNVDKDPEAHKLMKRLDGHPLALATAGAFLKESSITFAEYLQQYNIQWRALDALEELPDYPARTLFTTWNLSLDRIKRDNPAAASLLKFLAYLDNKDIWYDLLHGSGQTSNRPQWFIDVIKDRLAFERLMRALTNYCLVETSYERGSYSLHVCVHDWTLYELNQEFEMTLYQTAVDCISCHVSASDWDNLWSAKYNRVTSHAQNLSRSCFLTAIDRQHLDPKTMAALSTVAELLRVKGQLAAAEPIEELLLAWHDRNLGADNLLTLNTVNNLGNIYMNQGKLDQAGDMYRRALAGMEQGLGPDHLSTLQTVNNLGALYQAQGKLEQAEEMYKRALTGREQSLGTDHPSTLQTVSNLGALYWSQDKLDQAEEMYQRALAGREQACGPDHPSTLETVNNLGALYWSLDKLDQAEAMYQRALAGREQACGPDHLSTLETVNNLGMLYGEQDKPDLAEQMLQRALVGKEQACGPDQPSTLNTVYNLALLRLKQDRLSEAQEMLQRVRDGWEKSFGLQHPNTMEAVHRLNEVRLMITEERGPPHKSAAHQEGPAG